MRTGSGFPTPAHQWFFNGAPLTNGGRFAGANGNTLTISGAGSRTRRLHSPC